MKLKLDFSINIDASKINYSDKFIFLGSCFSEEISRRFDDLGFDVYSNPFGVLFHPLSIAENIISSINSEPNSILQQSDLFFSWDANRSVFAYSEKDLSDLLERRKDELKTHIPQASKIIITYGSSYIYRKTDSGEYVANCHKEPASLFSKELSEVAEMRDKWLECIDLILTLNPAVEFIFTVSPVRHTKDGLAENNLSKARLIDTIHQLKLNRKNVFYFPSYEIMMDELRDYRFYKSDLVHPSEEATDYIFSQFSACLLTSETLKIMEEYKQIKLMESHKLDFPESRSAAQFRDSLQQKKDTFFQKYPFLKK